MIISAIYSAHATTTGGRVGKSTARDSQVSVTLTSPKAMGGDGAPGTNPEELFAMGYSACFLGAVKAVGRRQKVAVPDETTINATVHFGELVEGGGFGIAAELEITMPGIDHAVATELVEAAHKICPYSNATRGNIDVKLSVA